METKNAENGWTTGGHFIVELNVLTSVLTNWSKEEEYDTLL